MVTVVTGGAGFIGSNLVEALVDKGREVIVLDDLSRGLASNPDNTGATLIQVDLRNRTQTERVMGKLRIDTMFHLAARIGNEPFLHGNTDSEIAALRDNCAIDSSVAHACIQNGIRKVVYTSSSAVYPVSRQRQLGVVLQEHDCSGLDAEGGYGQSKLVGEQLIDRLPTRKGIARIFNAYGKNADLSIAPHAITKFLMSAMLDQDIVIQGDGSQTRDYVHVSDCVKALLALEEVASEEGVVCNVGSGEATSINQLAELVVELTASKSRIIHNGALSLSSPVSRTADIRQARSKLGWTPEIRMKTGLLLTHKWLEQKRRTGHWTFS